MSTELQNVYPSPNITRLTEQKIIKQAGHVERMEETFLQTYENGGETT
jgi:hypothetical protein